MVKMRILIIVVILGVFSLTDGRNLSFSEGPPPPPETQIAISPDSLEFGDVEVNTEKIETVTITNDSSNDVLEIGQIADMDSLEEPFSIIINNCSDQILAPLDTCTLEVRFSPDDAVLFSDSFDIASNDPDENSITINVNGTGLSTVASSPPSNFDLVYPADRQTGLPSSFNFIWKKTQTPDSDPITYTLYYCDDQDITTNCSQVSVASLASLKNEGLVYASIGGNWMLLLIGSLFTCGFKEKKRIKIWLLIAMLMNIGGGMTLSACGGNGSNNPQEEKQALPPAAQPISGSGEAGYSVSGLNSGTTYYWKVVATDSNDASTETETRSFTTQ